jgi:hypothetical protein
LQCTKWNKRNGEYFRANYLQKKLDVLPMGGAHGGARRSGLGIPEEIVQDVIGVKQLVIMEYLMQLILRRFQEVIRVQ